MAKKKVTKKKKSNGKRKSSSNKMGINTSALLGMAAGVYAANKGLPQLKFYMDLDPKTKAVVKILAGEFLPKQDFVKKMLNDQEILNGAGNALSVLGMQELLTEMGFMSGDRNNLNNNDDLALALKGIEDISTVNADKDISTVNADVLGDDDDSMNEEILG